ncbi:hypothetical protein GGR07_000025 [Bacteroides pyogenes]|nr:hypothetical protein [Bacteroides pyogenes]SUV33605.1 Uncharacterised protein [Bacteroides pyogenes]
MEYTHVTLNDILPQQRKTEGAADVEKGGGL